MFWQTIPIDEGAASRLSAELGVSPVVARLLVQRACADASLARRFLEPRLQDIEDPFLVPGLAAAADRLALAVSRGESVLVFGDYDVDGVTSTTLLVSTLRTFGLQPRFTVPRRLEEGYGLSRQALERALEGGNPGLLVAVDCGTNSVAEVAWLRERGVDVVILDHHTSREAIPADCVLVNPHLHDACAGAPWRDLCTVGIVFKVVHGLLKRLREAGDDRAFRFQIRDHLDLVALGTIADLVPLTGENRILARAGLRCLSQPGRLGLGALAEVAGVEAGAELTPFDVSFRFGPRINASGRLADASLPIELLLSGDWTECLRIARQLDDCNRDRQEIERGIAEEAAARVLASHADAPALLLHDERWHPGVVGIVASRLVSRFHRPCIVLGQEGGVAKGSGRSVPGLNLVEVLGPLAGMLQHWGGHPMAVGVTVDPARIPELRAAFEAGVAAKFAGGIPERELEIAAWLAPEDLGEPLIDAVSTLQPFGQGNPEPVFGMAGRVFRMPLQPFGSGGAHLRGWIELPGGVRWSMVAWKMAENPLPAGVPLDLAVRLRWNSWNGRRSPQVELVDWRVASPR